MTTSASDVAVVDVDNDNNNINREQSALHNHLREELQEQQPSNEQHIHRHCEQERESFFAFSTSGKRFTWWSVIILTLLASCTIASVVILAVKSAQRNHLSSSSSSSSFQLLADINEVYCPWASTEFEPIPFTAWSNISGKCMVVHYGHAYRCSSHVDCLLIGTRCASREVLSRLRCLEPNSNHFMSNTYTSESNKEIHDKVCTLTITPEARQEAQMEGSFCTAQHTQCALCTGNACNGNVINCIPSAECHTQSLEQPSPENLT